MFTGIITHFAKVDSVVSWQKGLKVSLLIDNLDFSCDVGDSIAVNGVCSTVVKCSKNLIFFHYLEETLNKTTFGNLAEGMVVNIEPSLTLESKMSGHFVSGHVDGLGVIEDIEVNEPWGVLRVSFHKDLAPFFIYKGSICIDGISLTVAEINQNVFTCHIIPHTYNNTVLKHKQKGDGVNLECDFIGKYVYRNIQLGNIQI